MIGYTEHISIKRKLKLITKVYNLLNYIVNDISVLRETPLPYKVTHDANTMATYLSTLNNNNRFDKSE